jgi:AraC-like DNA-binding protein
MEPKFTRARPWELPPLHLELEVLLIKAHQLSNWNMANLRAPYWRFYMVDRPGGAIVFNEGGSRLHLVPERFVLIPPEFRYAAEQKAAFTQFYAHFLVKKNEMWRMPDEPVDRACGPAMFAARDRLLNHGKPGGWPEQFLVRRLIYEALDALPPETFSASPADGRISHARDSMKRRLREGITNDALAAAVGMNTNAFIRLFRERTGLTPQKYLTRERIAQSCLLLHHSALSIEQIAERCGFCDRYHFSRVFQKHREMGPATFRRTLG